MQRRHFLKSVAGASLAVASWRASASNPAPVRVTLPSPGSAGSAWQPMAKQLGLGQDADLSIDWVTADPGKMQVQLSAGSLDVGVFGAVGLATLRQRGSDIVLIGPALHNHGRWLVRGDSAFRKPADLRGKRIATTAETSETYQQARIAASLNGLDLKKDVQVIHGAPIANLALFERGDVDAIITLEPTASRLIGRGAREIARVADIWKEATGEQEDPVLVGLAANRKWLQANENTAAKLVRVFQRLNGAISENPDLLLGIAPQLGFKPEEEEAIQLLPDRLAPAYATKWDDSTFRTIDRQVEVAVQLGLLAKAPAEPLYVSVA